MEEPKFWDSDMSYTLYTCHGGAT